MAQAKLSSTSSGVYPGQSSTSLWPKGTTWADVAQANTMKNTWAPGTTWDSVKSAYDQKYPAAPQAPTSQSDPATVPKDALYNAQTAGVARTRDDTLAGIGRERNQALADYGYTGTFDQAGNLTGRTVDPNNPFSRAALLKRTYDQRAGSNTNNYASRGLLQSGAFQAAKDNTDFGYLQGMNENERNFDAVIGNLIGRTASANTNYATGLSTAGAENLARLLGGLV